jgi:ornithine--oxo-acid transaminase
MSFDVAKTLEERQGEDFALHSRYLNPQLVRVLKTIGMDRFYARGEGCYLWDRDGRRYLDLLSGFGVYSLGRGHPAIKAAIHEAIDLDTANLVQMDCALLPGLLAEQLVARTHPGIERAFFCNSGAEAVEAAIKFSRRHTGRERVLHADHSFHGLTTGALSLNGGTEFRKGFGHMLPSAPVLFGDIDALERELRRGDVAAFVVEPIQGKGVHEASDDYWPAVQELCRRHKTVFVADEVQTGLGRTGRFYAHEHWGLQPDIITTSKALSGGYVPVGAMLTSDKIFRSVYDSMDHAVVHSSTFGSNDLAMVAGLATLQAMDDEDIVDRAARNGELFQKALEPLADRYELIAEVRGKGMMIGIEFGAPTSRSLRRRWNAIERVRTGLFTQLVVVPLFQRHGILTQVAADNVNIIKLLPPLIAGEEEVAMFAHGLDDVMADAHEGSKLFREVGSTVVRSTLRRGE